MDLEDKKKALLKQISSMHREKSVNRKNASAKVRLHEAAKKSKTAPVVIKKDEPQKKKVLLFGQPGLFLGTLKSTLTAYCDVEIFHNINKACEYVLSNHIPLVIMDMDLPNDWRECHDLFTTGKTMYPDIEYIIYQMNKTPAEEVQVLEKQGAHVVNKPVDGHQLKDVVKHLIYGE